MENQRDFAFDLRVDYIFKGTREKCSFSEILGSVKQTKEETNNPSLCVIHCHNFIDVYKKSEFVSKGIFLHFLCS